MSGEPVECVGVCGNHDSDCILDAGHDKTCICAGCDAGPASPPLCQSCDDPDETAIVVLLEDKVGAEHICVSCLVEEVKQARDYERRTERDLRDIFAGRALTGMLANYSAHLYTEDAKTAYEIADLITDPARREAWRKHWHDGRRTSLNDIASRCWAHAKCLRHLARTA